MEYAEFSYANADHPRLKRWIIRGVEGLSGRKKLLRLYEIWREQIVGSTPYQWGGLLNLINVSLSVSGSTWPPKQMPDGPLVVIANHPFGIGDGLAMLALCEQLDRPYRILINNELLKVPEIRPYSLPVDFEETAEALRNNMRTRQEALRLLKEGVTIIVFPGGGVATAKKPFGRAEELPWKTFTAKLIRSAKATVLPVFFEGQNSPLFHMASRLSLTLRLSLLIREFRRIVGSRISVRVGEAIPFEELSTFGNQKEVIDHLHERVHALAPPELRRSA
ncbi:lysophospholipid acyltransferase family protein [Pseudovibrio sp. SPO723]|uniref:lysophospholipid acyltransferase family protein n=1 Tax=Nesiotobacter zosterae TaxID=392721 RepID=UPI0029C4E8FD|nr:lysophospholipid acyltransferase family protein [Pseudovibrio sp. SPO723]MDX5594604.1 lysophospholipid acyltransferase family protein [Pseudovibrio sp. SPO723]